MCKHAFSDLKLRKDHFKKGIQFRRVYISTSICILFKFPKVYQGTGNRALAVGVKGRVGAYFVALKACSKFCTQGLSMTVFNDHVVYGIEERLQHAKCQH